MADTRIELSEGSLRVIVWTCAAISGLIGFAGGFLIGTML